MSGGVDSSVTAALLAKQDYDLSAVFMRNWDTRDESGSDIGCEWEKDWEDVQRVCRETSRKSTGIVFSRPRLNRGAKDERQIQMYFAIAQYIPPKPGPILLHPDLTQIGTHQGLYTLTIGQNARVPGQPKKMFVARKRVEDNSIVVVDSS
ncbi:hypothetical protein FRC09_015780 [Ceratobasidium sp. 395]|nr:hypothetical protein FRC09_015780 [Ceratobasidium sp. 395]